MFVYLIYIPILIILIILGFFVFIKNRKSPVNISFSLFVLSIAFWVFALIFADGLKNYEQVFLWNQLAMIGPAFVPVTFLIFVIYYLKEYQPSIFTILALFIPAIIILIFIPTKYNIKEIKIRDWGSEVVPGSLYLFFLGYIIIYMGCGLYLLAKKYFRVSGLTRMQIKYIFGGIFLGASLGVCTNLIFLFCGISNFSILAPFSALIMSVCISYAILKYQLMDIKVIIQKGLIYAMLFGLTFIFYSLIIRLLTELLENSVQFISAMTVFISSLFIVLTFKPMERFFQKITNRIFFKQEYDYSKTLSQLGEALNEIVQVNALVKQVVKTLSRSLQVRDIKVLLKNPKEKIYKVVGVNKKNNKIFEISIKSEIAKYLLKNNVAINRDWLQIKIEENEKHNNKNYQEIISKLDQYKVVLALPLIFQKELIGIMTLGKKLSGDPFSEKDIGLLSIFSNQLAVAINNAWLFENLEQKVKDRTKDLKRAYNELSKIDKAKTEFISVASHQLRTPLTAIKGILDMSRSGDFGELNELQSKYISKAFESNERLIRLVNDLLNISRIEMGRMKLKIENFAIDSMIRSVMEELSEHARNKSLSLILKTKANKKYNVSADPEQIRQVLVNLIDNAIKYTDRGKVVAKIIDSSDALVVGIADTGRGIGQQDLKYIFKKYTRAKYETSRYIGGEGLGLYIVKKILEAHNGEVWAESAGINKGASFYFNLPRK